MTRLQFIRIEAVLVDLSIRERRAKDDGDASERAAVEADRTHLLHVVTQGRPLSEITVDGVHDVRLETLLTRLESQLA